MEKSIKLTTTSNAVVAIPVGSILFVQGSVITLNNASATKLTVKETADQIYNLMK